jgi:hypothetical protein
MGTKADRYNSGKAKYSMIDLTCMEQCARVLEFGAKKYARDNWKKGLPISEILDSQLRHIAALQRGEFIDPESGLPHIGHIQCNSLFLGNPNNTVDIEPDHLLAQAVPVTQELKDRIEKLVEGVQIDLAEKIMNEDYDTLDQMNDDVDHDWSRMQVESMPVSMEDYNAFVYMIEHPGEPNDELKRLMKGANSDYNRYATTRGLCAPWIGVNDHD